MRQFIKPSVNASIIRLRSASGQTTQRPKTFSVSFQPLAFNFSNVSGKLLAPSDSLKHKIAFVGLLLCHTQKVPMHAAAALSISGVAGSFYLFVAGSNVFICHLFPFFLLPRGIHLRYACLPCYFCQTTWLRLYLPVRLIMDVMDAWLK